MSVQESVLDRAIRERREALDELERLRAAALAVVSNAEPDDDFEGQFIEYLVPFAAIDALRALTKAPR